MLWKYPSALTIDALPLARHAGKKHRLHRNYPGKPRAPGRMWWPQNAITMSINTKCFTNLAVFHCNGTMYSIDTILLPSKMGIVNNPNIKSCSHLDACLVTSVCLRQIVATCVTEPDVCVLLRAWDGTKVNGCVVKVNEWVVMRNDHFLNPWHSHMVVVKCKHLYMLSLSRHVTFPVKLPHSQIEYWTLVVRRKLIYTP